MILISDPNQIPAANGSSLYGNFRTRTFADIYSSAEEFMSDYHEVQIPQKLTDESATTLFYLLYARYGNSNIASSDETQFKYKVFSTIFMYGPAWQKRLDLQDKLINMTEDDLMRGATAIHNTALNPSTAPSTQTLEELAYINQQNATKHKRGKLEAYATLYALIETDVTEEFLGKFKKLFLTVVAPEEPLWYITEDEDDT